MTGVAAFSLTSTATQAAAPFTVGHVFKRGDVAAGQQLVAGFAKLQVVSKNTWPDGSLKFALVSGRAALTANVPLSVALSVGTPTGGVALTTADLKTTGITASIAAGAFGTVSWATTDWDAPFMTWISGPQMSSWLYHKAIGSDAHLVGWMEVRLYAGGAVEVLPWVENGYLMVAAPTNKSATYAFTLGGAERFNAALNVLNHTRTPLVSGSTLTHWLGADPAVTPSHDPAYLQASKIIPAYSVTASATTLDAQVQTYAPFQQGGYSPSMGTPGYHPSIGLLPEWDTCYVTTGDARAYRSVVVNGYGAGRFGIHFRDENTNRPIRFSQRPTLGLGDGSGVTGVGANTAGTVTADATGGTPPAYASTHHPSMGFVAYLVTGRFYHLETLQFLAAINYLKNSDTARNNADGIFLSAAGANTTRGVGWAIRTLTQAAAITPDADALSAEFVASMSANIAWHHARYVAQSNNPQGWIQPYSDYTAPTRFNTAVTAGATTIIFPSGYVFPTDGYYVGWELVIGGQLRTITAYTGSTRTATLSTPFTFTTGSAEAELRDDNIYFEATWMQDFVTAAFGYAKSIGLALSGPNAVKLAEFFAWKAKSIVGRFGTAAADEYLYRDAATYNVAVSPSNSSDWVTGAGPWFADWGALYAATNTTGVVKELGDGTLRGGNYPEATSYWGNLQPALAYAVEHGIAGADAAYARMVGAPNFGLLQADLTINPVWAVTPHATSEDAPVTITTGPSFRWDTESLFNDAFMWGTHRGLGMQGAEVPTGFAQKAFLLDDIDVADPAGTEYRNYIPSPPAGLSLNPNSSFVYTGSSYTGTRQVFKNGVEGLGQFVFEIGGITPPPADTAPPTMNGAITQGVTTSTSIAIGWAAASDNVGVMGYMVSKNNGATYIDVGLTLAHNFTSLPPSTACQFKVVGYDLAGNVATTPLAATFSTTATPDTQVPTQIGSLAETHTATTITVDWSGTTAFDDIGVTGREYSINGGPYFPASNGEEVLKLHVFTGLVPDTGYAINLRAADASGKKSVPLSITATTSAAVTLATTVTVPMGNRNNAIQANLTGMKWAFFDQTTPDALQAPTAQGDGESTDSSGLAILNITGTQLMPGQVGWLIFSNSNGDPDQSNQIAYTGPVIVA